LQSESVPPSRTEPAIIHLLQTGEYPPAEPKAITIRTNGPGSPTIQVQRICHLSLVSLANYQLLFRLPVTPGLEMTIDHLEMISDSRRALSHGLYIQSSESESASQSQSPSGI
jgi:hypothetical protein